MPRAAMTARVKSGPYPSQWGGDDLLTLGVACAPFWLDGPFSERTPRPAVHDGAQHLCWRVKHNPTRVLAQELKDEILHNWYDCGSFVESKPNDAIVEQRTSRAVPSFYSWSPAAGEKLKSGGGR